MKKQKRPVRTIAYVRWFDASFQADECTVDELVPGIVVESAGLIAREDKHSVSLALDYYEVQGLWRRTLHIPKAYILEIRRVKV